MSAPIEDGGPVFAAATTGDWQIGMSLRDWFAGQAMAAMIAKSPFLMKWARSKAEAQNEIARTQVMPAIAAGAYLYADAMLTARKEQA